MQTAVTIPEDIYAAAERVAGETGQTRDELYAAAVAAYVQRHDFDAQVAALNQVVAEVGDEDTAWIDATSAAVLRSVEW